MIELLKFSKYKHIYFFLTIGILMVENPQIKILFNFWHEVINVSVDIQNPQLWVTIFKVENIFSTVSCNVESKWYIYGFPHKCCYSHFEIIVAFLF